MKPRLANGKAVVPTTAAGPGFIGDGVAPLTPQHPLYKEWTQWIEKNGIGEAAGPLAVADGQLGVLAEGPTRDKVRLLVTPEGKLAVMREYSPDEPRDDHGRWASGGASEAAANIMTAPGWSGYYPPDVVDSMRQALGDALARNPELANGLNPLVSVNFLSGQKPNDMPSEQWQALQRDAQRYGPIATTVAAEPRDVSFDGVTSDAGGTRIIVNDLTSYDPTSQGAAASQTPYGTMTHEIGHAYFAEHGYGDPQDMSDLMNTHGIGPADVVAVSRYAASSPPEALAELYSAAHTPGFSLPADIAPKYAALEAEASKTLPTSITAPFPPAYLSNTPENNRKIAEAAEANVAANKWVASAPGWVRVRATGKLKEYSPDQPRDTDGKWSGAAETPPGGETWRPGTVGKAVYIPSENRVLAWQVKTPDGFPHHGDVLEAQTGLPFSTKAGEVGLRPVSSPTLQPDTLAHSVTIRPDGGIRYQSPLNATDRYGTIRTAYQGEPGWVASRVAAAIPGTFDTGIRWGGEDHVQAATGPWRAGLPHLGESAPLGDRLERLERFVWQELREYSPDQPRDEHGRWTSGGGTDNAQSWQRDAPWHGGANADTHALAADFASRAVSTAPLTDSQKTTIANYAADSKTINAVARGQQNPDARTVAEINNLDTALNGAHANQDLTVFRGITAPAAGVIEPGGRYTDTAFLSTSLLESTPAEYAAQFADPSHPDPNTLLEIRVPAGSNVLPVSNLMGDPTVTMSGHPEAEVLFPRNAVFEVTGGSHETWQAPQGEYHYTHITMDYKGVNLSAGQ